MKINTYFNKLIEQNIFAISSILVTFILSGCGGSISPTEESDQETPDDFTFFSEQNTPINRFVYSNSITLSGLQDKARISISEGTFSIDGEAFGTTDSWVANGQKLRVRHLSPKQYEHTSTTFITVGSYTTTFSSITAIADPNQLDSDNDGVVDSDDNMPMDGSRYSIPLWLDYVEQPTPLIIDDNIEQTSELKVIDMDLDGDLDIVPVAFLTDEVYWWDNVSPSDLRFEKRIIANVKTNGTSIDLDDLDGDGDIDLAIGGSYQHAGYSLAWFENTGDPKSQFIMHPVLMTSVHDLPRVVKIVDLDKDGNLDILLGDHSHGLEDPILNRPNLML